MCNIILELEIKMENWKWQIENGNFKLEMENGIENYKWKTEILKINGGK